MKSSLVYLLFFILFIGSCLRFYNLGQKDFWLDEVYEVDLALRAKSISNLFSIIKSSRIGAHPPFSHILRYLSLRVRVNEFFARLPSAIFGVLTICVLFFIGRSWFGAEVGLLSSFLLSISSFDLFYSQEARPYAIFTFFALLSLYFLYKAVYASHKSSCQWFLYIAATAALCYTHYFAIIIIAIEGGIIILLDITNRKFVSLWKFLLAVLIVFILYLPWVPVFIIHSNTQTSTNLPGPEVSLSLIINTIRQISGGSRICFLSYIILFAIGVLSHNAENRKEILIALAWICLAFPLLLIVLIRGHRFYHPRYLLHILPIFLIIVSQGVCELIKFLKFALPCSMYRRGGIIMWVIPILMFAFINTEGLKRYYKTQKRPWREAITYFSKNVFDGDIVLTKPHYLRHPLLYYLSVKEIYTDPAYVILNRKKIIVASNIILENRAAFSKVKRMWLITENTEQPDWVNSGFRMVKQYKGLMGRLYIYFNFVNEKRKVLTPD